MSTSLANLSPEEDRFVGCILGSVIGDTLGASVEGWSISRIKRTYGGKICTFVPANHMGTLGVRCGVYTDDSNSTLALGSSLIENRNLVPKHAAMQYGKFWKNPPFEGLPTGYPGSAMAVMQDVLDGKDYKQTGRGSFPEGSFANGGIMRIAPVGLAFRNATDEQLHTAVQWAIISSHVHPEAVDGAWLQAKAISILLKATPNTLSPLDFIQQLRTLSRNKEMQDQLDVLLKLIARPKMPDDSLVVRTIGDTFQLKAVDAFPNALWAVYNNWNNPEACIVHAVNLGGDADTVGCIAGAMIGALHGHQWIPSKWWSNMNDTGRGRSYCVNVAKQLATLDLKEPVLDEEEKAFSFSPSPQTSAPSPPALTQTSPSPPSPPAVTQNTPETNEQLASTSKVENA